MQDRHLGERLPEGQIHQLRSLLAHCSKELSAICRQCQSVLHVGWIGRGTLGWSRLTRQPLSVMSARVLLGAALR